MKPFVLLSICAVLLAGCSSSKTSQDQLVAQGKGFEVTVTELDQLLRQAPPVHREEVDAARRAILNQLIDDKLFAREATNDKLDRDPETMQQIEAIKRGILARAYVTRLFGDMPEPSDQAIRTFYTKHPNLFSDRTSYTVNQLPLTGTPEAIATYRTIFDEKGMAALQAEMQKRSRLVVPSHATILDLQLARVDPVALAKLTVGSQIAYQADGLSHVGIITSIEHGQLSLEQARDEIVQRIFAERRLGILRADSARLRQGADVAVVQSTLQQRAAK